MTLGELKSKTTSGDINYLAMYAACLTKYASIINDNLVIDCQTINQYIEDNYVEVYCDVVNMYLYGAHNITKDLVKGVALAKKLIPYNFFFSAKKIAQFCLNDSYSTFDPPRGIKYAKLLLDRYYDVDTLMTLSNYYLCHDDCQENLDYIEHTLKEMSDKNIKEATYFLALGYMRNTYGTENRKEAVRLFTELAKSDHKKAQGRLAICYYEGIGVEANLSHAIHLVDFMDGVPTSFSDKDARKIYKILEDGAAINNAKALYQLGKSYKYGTRFYEANSEKCITLLKRAIANGSRRAKKKLADCYEVGQCVPKDAKMAGKLYRESSARNYNVDEMFEFGETYRAGNHVTQDDEEALYWYQNAADNGHTTAAFYTGYYYDMGIGTTKDLKSAIHYYEIAAEKGNVSAMYNLGYIYYYNNTIDNNREKARYWWQKAADNGSEKAVRALDCL